jgi:hypothetical protein
MAKISGLPRQEVLGLLIPFRNCIEKNDESFRPLVVCFLSFRYYSTANIRVPPGKGYCGLGVGADVFHQLSGKIGTGGEDAKGDASRSLFANHIST